MLFGEHPFRINNKKIVEIKDGNGKKIYENLKFPEDIEVDEVAKDLIQKLLTFNPSERLGSNEDANDIKNHKFFEGINWDEYSQKK